MLKKNTILMAALAAILAVPLHASAADEQELAEIRAQIKQMKEDYEARIQSLEQRLQAAQANKEATIPQTTGTAAERAPAPTATTNTPPAPSSAGSTASANGFNPAISLILGGTYANLKQDPQQYRLQGFMPGGEIGPGSRSFNLGESELTFSANIDHVFSGQLTAALAKDNSVSVEESFIQAKGLIDGVNLKAGRFLSSIGYLNEQHVHTWDFVDAPLAYQAFLGGQYKQDGLQLKWLAPTDRFVQIGLEVGNGSAFPGTERNKNGVNSAAVSAHVGDDIGASGSWRGGISYLRTNAENRSFTELTENYSAFSGQSGTWIVDGVLKWAPGGNANNTNVKLQGEYFRRNENGTLSQTAGDPATVYVDNYRATQSGWYLQGIYQFMPGWRTGLRYDRLSSSTPNIGLGSALFPSLASYSPSRTSLMFDYSPSEFSRLRLQLAQDKSRPGATDNQIFLQYIMSLGAHGAHNY